MPRAALLLIVAAAGCAAAAPDSVPSSPPAPVAPPATAVLHLEPYLRGTGLLTVPVTVGDSTLPFLFDTGGGGTLFTPEAARAAGCEPFGRVTGFRHSGEAVHAERCPATAIEVGGWVAPERETGVFDLMALLPEGVPPLGGLLALQTFDGQPITLELGEGRVVVESPSSFSARVSGMAEVPLREGRQSGGAMLDVFIPFAAAGGPLWMELDSGNTGPVYLAPHAAAQLGLDLSTAEPRTVTLDLIGFGPVQVQAQEKEMIYDGLLNAAFLRQLRMTLDLAEGRAWVAAVDDPS